MSCPNTDLKKCLDVAKGAERSFARARGCRNCGQDGGNVLYIEQVKCHGDHFDAWSLPSRLRFLSSMGSRSRSFQRSTSRLIAFHYPRQRNLTQFGCDDVVDAWRTAQYDFAQCAQNLQVIALKPSLNFTDNFVDTCGINYDTKVVFCRLL